MQQLSDLYRKSKNLHHAYICEGPREEVFQNLCLFCQNDLKFDIKANPDFVYEEYDKLLILHARRLREIQMNKTTDRGRKIYIVAFNFITKEAQNALLKVLEEPTDGTHFFFITPSAHIFLPTVLSRVSVLNFKSEINKKDVGEEFFKKDFKGRSSMVSKLTEQIKKEKASKAEAIVLAQGFLKAFYQKNKKSKNFSELKKAGEIEKIINYLHDNSASTKNILDYLSLID